MIKAIIFDMDGVILNSMPMHIHIWKNIFEKRGIKFNLKEFEKYNGTSTKEIAQRIIREHNLKEVYHNIVKEKRESERKFQDKIIFFKDTLSSLKKLRKQGYKLALATSAMPPMVKYVKKRFHFNLYFDAITSSVEVKHSKPSPDIFILAAKKIGIKNSECAVVEDSLNGIIAAKKAGMSAVAITNTFKKKVFIKKADLIINSLTELTKKDFGDKLCAE